jgi:hypothetical protein
MLRNLGLRIILIATPSTFSTATFIFTSKLRLFYFMPRYYYTPFISAFTATFILCVHVCLPQHFLFFLTLQVKSKPFLQYSILIQEPYHTAPTVAKL